MSCFWPYLCHGFAITFAIGLPSGVGARFPGDTTHAAQMPRLLHHRELRRMAPPARYFFKMRHYGDPDARPGGGIATDARQDPLIVREHTIAQPQLIQ